MIFISSIYACFIIMIVTQPHKNGTKNRKSLAGGITLVKKLIISIVFLFLLVLIAFFIHSFFFHKKKEVQSFDNYSSRSEHIQLKKKGHISANHKYTFEEFQAGVNVLIYGHPVLENMSFLFNHLHSLGVNSIALVFPLFQEGWQASKVEMDNIETPTTIELQYMIQSAKANGLSVMLRPILDEKSLMKTGHWRGNIRPNDIHDWFRTYRTLMIEYAKIAEIEDVEIFSIGTELTSLQTENEQWDMLVNEVQEVYSGKLTYSFNWDGIRYIHDTNFVSRLDYIGIDAYFPLDRPDGASAMELEDAWEQWVIEVKEEVDNMPLLITEVGVIPIEGAYRTPYAWDIPNGIINPQVQVNYYEATFNSWQQVSKGIYWWSVTPYEERQRIGYSPLSLPTEQVIKRHFLH